MLFVFALLTLIVLTFMIYGAITVFIDAFKSAGLVPNVISGVIVFALIFAGWILAGIEVGFFRS